MSTAAAAIAGAIVGYALGAKVEKLSEGVYKIEYQFPAVKVSKAVSVGVYPTQLTPEVERGILYIKSDSTNSDRVFIGTPPITRDTGYQLGVGEELIIAASNLNVLHAISNAGFQRVKVIVLG